MNIIRRSRCGRLRLSGRIGDVFKTPPRRQRTLIPRRKLRYDLTIGHGVAAAHRLDGRILPPRHTALDTLVTNQFRRQTRFAEDLGGRLPRKISDSAHLFECVGIGDTITSHIGNSRQSTQQLNLLITECSPTAHRNTSH